MNLQVHVTLDVTGPEFTSPVNFIKSAPQLLLQLCWYSFGALAAAGVDAAGAGVGHHADPFSPKHREKSNRGTSPPPPPAGLVYLLTVLNISTEKFKHYCCFSHQLLIEKVASKDVRFVLLKPPRIKSPTGGWKEVGFCDSGLRPVSFCRLRKEKKEHLWTGKSPVFSPSWPQWRDDPQWTTYRQTRQKIKSRPRWGLRRQHVSLPYLCLSIVYQKWLILQQLEKIKIMSQVSPSTLRSKNDNSICFMNVKSTRQVQFCLFRSGLSQLGLPALSLFTRRWFICH